MDYITGDQLKRVTKRSSFEASKLIVTDWVIITGIFDGCLLAKSADLGDRSLYSGARQLGLGVIVMKPDTALFSFEVDE